METVLRTLAKSLAAICFSAVSVTQAAMAAGQRPDCHANADAMPVSRIVEIDASGGPMFGSMTDEIREPSFLKRKEIVLTFDDGPMPWVTRSILDTLDAYCAKAMFFSVGRMAIAYPSTVRDIVARGHTLGSHTYSHPYNLPKMPAASAQAEIERGLAAVSAAAGRPITPFFRFTGLADSASLLTYLASRHIASFTVDAVTNDSYISETSRLVERTIAEIERTKGGIVLFHDIKPTTAKALPQILARLKAKDYKLVHVTSSRPAVPSAGMLAEFAPKVAKTLRGKEAETAMLPFYGAIPPDKIAPELSPVSVTSLAPASADRAAVRPAETKPAAASRAGREAAGPRDTGAPASPRHANTPIIESDATHSSSGEWTVQIKPTLPPLP